MRLILSRTIADPLSAEQFMLYSSKQGTMYKKENSMEYGNDSISQQTDTKKRSRLWGTILLRACLIMVLLSLISQPALSKGSAPLAPSAMPDWKIIDVDAPRLFTNMTDRALAFKPDGTPCAAYGADGLYFACYDKDLKEWIVTIVDKNEAVGQYAALDFFTHPVTGVTNAYVSYYDASMHNLLDKFGNPILDGGNPIPVGGALKLAFTSVADVSTMVYPAIQCTVHPGWTLYWCIMTVPTAPPTDPWRKRAGLTEGVPELFSEQQAEPAAPEEAIPEQATPADDIDFMARVEQIFAPLTNLFKKDNPTLNFDTKGVGKFTSISADSWGIYISYYDDRDVPSVVEPPDAFPYSRNLNFAYWNGVDWYFEVVDNYQDQGRIGLWSSLKVDFNHNVHIAYMSEKYDDLLYAFWNVNKPDEWTRVVVDGEEPEMRHTGSMCSIALYDANIVGVKGEPYISYLDFSDDQNGNPDGDLRVAKLVNLKTNTWERGTVDSQGITGWWSSIAVNRNKNIFISYYLAYKNSAIGDLRLATGKIGNWTLRTLRSGDALEGQFTSIALDPSKGNELPAILNFNATAGKLQYTYNYGTNRWATNYVDEFGHDVGYATSLALTAAGSPRISYLDLTLSKQKFAWFFGNTGFTRLLDYWPYAGLFSSIDEQNGMTYMASYASANADVIYGHWNGSFWPHQYVQRTYEVGQYVSMKLDSKGIPRLSYYDATNKNLVYAAWNVSASKWITDIIDSPGDVGKYSSLALSSDDRPYISYYDSVNDDYGFLRIAFESPNLPGVWIYQIVDDGDNGTAIKDNVGWFSSIDLDGANRPSISYYNATKGDLKFATYNAGWTNVTLDPLSSTQNLGLYTSMKINRTAGDRHICYYNATGGDLWYARFSGGSWEYQGIDGDPAFTTATSPSVDSVGGDIGYTCSIDLTAAGEPAISYYDNTRGDLKLAYTYGIGPDKILPDGSIFLPIILRP